MAVDTGRAAGPARTIDDVIERLDEIIARARQEGSRLGFFATLYRNVTVEVKRKIGAGSFDDGPRMERLDVTFANRYISALECWRRGAPTSRCWNTAFTVATHWPPIVLQHLLIGMNAHINLDLGVAAAVTCPGDQLAPLKHDFEEINDVLASMIEGVQSRLGRVSPWMIIVDRLGGRTDQAMMNWSIGKARTAAWSVAQRLAPLGADDFEREISELDNQVELLARVILYPGWLLGAANLVVRLTEPRSAAAIMDLLA